MEDNSYVYIMDASIQIPFPPPTWKYLFPRISFPKYIIDTIFSSPIKFEKPKKNDKPQWLQHRYNLEVRTQNK